MRLKACLTGPWCAVFLGAIVSSILSAGAVSYGSVNWRFAKSHYDLPVLAVTLFPGMFFGVVMSCMLMAKKRHPVRIALAFLLSTVSYYVAIACYWKISNITHSWFLSFAVPSIGGVILVLAWACPLFAAFPKRQPALVTLLVAAIMAVVFATMWVNLLKPMIAFILALIGFAGWQVSVALLLASMKNRPKCA
jgi:hypothetical protein